MKRLFKPRFILLYPLVVWLLVAAHTTERQFNIGIVLALLGMGVRLWANGYVGHAKVNSTQKQRGDAKIGRLITGGPYAFVRHPLYLGSVLIGIGMCVIAGNLWVSLVAVGFFLSVYRRKMAQEEGLLRDEVGASYLQYHGAVPRWLPMGRCYPDRQGVWSWQGIAASKEWKTVIWVIVLLLVFYFRKEIVQERELFSPKDWWKHVTLLSVMVILMLVDGVAELMKRSARTPRAVLGGSA